MHLMRQLSNPYPDVISLGVASTLGRGDLDVSDWGDPPES